MKIINEKGKLFGLVNILDLITIVLIIAVVFGAYTKFFRGGTNLSIMSSNKTKEMEYVVRLKPNYETYFKQFSVGDKMVDEVNKKRYVDAEITNVEIKDAYRSVTDENGTVLKKKHPYFKEAYITIKATVLDKDPIFKVGNQEIRVGTPHWVTTKLCEFSGTIYEIKE